MSFNYIALAFVSERDFPFVSLVYLINHILNEMLITIRSLRSPRR